MAMDRFEILTAESKTLDAYGTRAVAIKDAKSNPEAEYVLDTKTGHLVWDRSTGKTMDGNPLSVLG